MGLGRGKRRREWLTAVGLVLRILDGLRDLDPVGYSELAIPSELSLLAIG